MESGFGVISETFPYCLSFMSIAQYVFSYYATSASVSHCEFIFSACHMSVDTEIFKGTYLLPNTGGQKW